MTAPFEHVDLDGFLAARPAEPDWDWSGLFAHGDVVLEAGDPGVGKSMNAVKRSVIQGTGGGSHLGEAVAARRVLVFDLESPDDVVFSRLHAFGLTGRVDGFAYVHRPAGFNLLDSDTIARLRQTIVEHRAQSVLIDSLRRAAPGLDENDSRQVSTVFSALRDIAAELHVTIIVIHHPRKPVGDAKVEALYAARGSGDLIGSVDSYLFYRRLPDGLVRIEHAKARRGREHTHLHFRITSDDTGSPVIEHITIEDEPAEQTAEDALDWIATYVDEHPGQPISHVEQAFAKHYGRGGRVLARQVIAAATERRAHKVLAILPGKAANGKYLYPATHLSLPLANSEHGEHGEHPSQTPQDASARHLAAPYKGRENGKQQAGSPAPPDTSPETPAALSLPVVDEVVA